MTTLAEFRTIQNDLPFYVFNTHYDERGLQSRTESSKLILKRVNELVAKSRSPPSSPPLVFLVGDLNSPDTEDGYRALTGWRYVSDRTQSLNKIFLESNDQTTFLDARHELHTRIAGFNVARLLGTRYGDWQATFTGFGEHDPRNVIDVVLIANTGAVSAVYQTKNAVGEDVAQKAMQSVSRVQWAVTRYGVIPNRFEGGFLVSDHRLVIATVKQIVVGLPEL